MPVLKALAVGVVHVLLAEIFDEVTMTTNDFMAEQEVFDLLKKKKQPSGVYEKSMDSPTLSSPIHLDIVVKQL